MTEAQLYELLGRKESALADLRGEYARLLGMLQQVCSGEIEPSRVTVDQAAQSWSVAPAQVPVKRAGRKAQVVEAVESAPPVTIQNGEVT